MVRSDFDRHNFDPVEGMVLGWLGPPGTWPFDARGGDCVEVSTELFTSVNGLVRIRARDGAGDDDQVCGDRAERLPLLRHAEAVTDRIRA
jgi:hypothetical protein